MSNLKQAKDKNGNTNTKKYAPLKTRIINAKKINTTRYQREIEQARVNRIMNNFRLEQMNILKVALRADGIYYLIDGQHTYIATTQLFGDNIDFTCVVVDCTSPDWTSLTEEQFEARIFTHQHDNTKQLTAQEKFNGAFIGAEERETQIVELFKKYGYEVQTKGRQSAGNKSVACVKTLVDIYDKHGLDILERTLIIVDNAYGGKAEALENRFMMGIANFVNTFDSTENYDDKRFWLALNKYADEPKRVIGAAKDKADRSRYTKLRSIYKCLEDQFVEIYNKGKKSTNRLLP